MNSRGGMMVTTTEQWRLGATQERSRETESLIGTAARELLEEHAFEDVRVADIAARAGVSVGGFYRRFRDKRAVLHLADEDFLDDCRAAFDEAMSDEHTDALDLRGLATAYIGLMVRKFREHRRAILQILRHADPRDGAVYAERAAAFNNHVHGRFRELLRRRRSEIRHSEVEPALNMAIFLVSAGARDAVWRGSLSAYPVRVDDDALVRELVRAFVAYLGSDR